MILLILLTSLQSFAFYFFPEFPENEQWQSNLNNSCTLNLIKESDKKVELQNFKLDITGDANNGEVFILIEEKFSKSKLKDVVDVIANPDKLNQMSEVVRVTEHGSAYQKTKKETGDNSKYVLATEAGGVFNAVLFEQKIPIGVTRSICVRSDTTNSIQITCKNGADAGTKVFINSAGTTTSCSQAGDSVLYNREITVNAKKFAKFGQSLTGYQVAFRSGMSGVRNNLGLSQMVYKADAKAAYALHDCSIIEESLVEKIKTQDSKPKETPEVHLDQ